VNFILPEAKGPILRLVKRNTHDADQEAVDEVNME
jgi:hypothetical protein